MPVEVFFKDFIPDSSLGETKYYVILIEFHKKDSPYIHSFIWKFNAPNIENEAAFIELIDQTINAQLPDRLNDPELFS